MEEQKYLNLNISKKIVEEIEKKAIEKGIPVVIAICNKWGIPIVIHFMDNALPASYDIAVNKAYTSATIRISTSKLQKLAENGGDLFGINNTNNNKIIAFPGGIPLEVNGEVIGAIGISGGTVDYDDYLATFGESLYKGVIECLKVKS